MRGSKRSNLRKRTLNLKIQLFVLAKNLTKKVILVARSIFKFGNSQRKTLGGWVITYIRVGVRDVPWWLAHEAKAGEVIRLALGPLILLGAGGVITGEVEVTEGCTRSGHHLLELHLLLLVPEVVLLLVVALAVVISLGVVILVGGGVELLPLGAVGDEVGGVTTLEAALGDLLLSLRNLCRAQNFLASRAISSSGMLSYYSSEAAHKEDKTNSKAYESIVLVGLATWPPTRAQVIKALLEKEASWLGRPFLDNSWDFNLLNNFSVSWVAKSADSSKAVIFMPKQNHQEHTTIF
jgi:hypothetical protein